MVSPRQLQTEFSRRFGGQPRLFRAPARINLIGEHTDYSDGFVMPLNTALYTTVAMTPRTDERLRVHAMNFDATCEAGLDDELERGGDEPWFEYVKGVAWALQRQGLRLPGADVLVHGGIPVGGGLSSSASLACALGLGLTTLAGAPLDRRELARTCQQAESGFVDVNCGIMDPFVIANGRGNQAMKLDCRSLQAEFVAIPGHLAVLVVDSGVKHRLAAGAYNQRRAECERATRTLAARFAGIKALRDASLVQLDACRDELSQAEFRRARHVITENQRVHDAQTALVAGDGESLGALLDASHASLRDDFEVSCKELDTLVGIAKATPGVFGTRMVGGGFGGCAIALVDRAQLEPAATTVLEAYGAQLGRQPWWHVCAPAPAAEEIQ